MRRTIRRLSAFPAAVCWLLLPPPAGAAERVPIKDEAHAFSAAAVQKAEEGIQDIKRRYHRNLVIEFVPAVPGEGWWNKLKRWTLSRNPHNHPQFYKDWATEQARKAGPNSIFILICREPAPLKLEVAAGWETRKQEAFTPADADRLQERLLPLFREGDYDRGLLDAVVGVRQALRDNQAAQAAPLEPFPWSTVAAIILPILGFWVCVEFMSMFRENNPRQGFTQGPYGGGSFLAGLFATMNTYWFADLIGARRAVPLPTAEPAPEHAAAQPADAVAGTEAVGGGPSPEESGRPFEGKVWDDASHAGRQDYARDES